MNSQRITSLALPVLIVAALTSCAAGGATPGGAGGAGGGSGTGSAGTGATATGHSDSGCLEGKTWNLDVQSQASQMLTILQSKGQATKSATGSGSQTITFNHGGTTKTTTDLTFKVVTALDSNNLLTTTQHQTGPSTSNWAWKDGTNVISFTHWVANISVETSTELDGKVSSSTAPLTSGTSDGADMTVVCTGDTLTTKTGNTPFTMHWSASH